MIPLEVAVSRFVRVAADGAHIVGAGRHLMLSLYELCFCCFVFDRSKRWHGTLEYYPSILKNRIVIYFSLYIETTSNYHVTHRDSIKMSVILRGVNDLFQLVVVNHGQVEFESKVTGIERFLYGGHLADYR